VEQTLLFPHGLRARILVILLPRFTLERVGLAVPAPDEARAAGADRERDDVGPAARHRPGVRVEMEGFRVVDDAPAVSFGVRREAGDVAARGAVIPGRPA